MIIYRDDIKLFTKNEELETLIYAARIYSQDIGIEFSIEKYAMLVMKRGKRHQTDIMEQPKKCKWKKKLRKSISGELESYSRQNYVAETLSKE